MGWLSSERCVPLAVIILFGSGFKEYTAASFPINYIVIY